MFLHAFAKVAFTSSERYTKKPLVVQFSYLLVIVHKNYGNRVNKPQKSGKYGPTSCNGSLKILLLGFNASFSPISRSLQYSSAVVQYVTTKHFHFQCFCGGGGRAGRLSKT